MASTSDLSSVTASNPIRAFHLKEYSITTDYEVFVDTILGVGGNAKIYSCKSRASQELYAVKVLPDVQQSIVEAELHWQACASDSIVKVENVYKTRWVDGKAAILLVMENMPGGDLYEHFEKRGHHPFSEPQVATITRQIATAVAFLHSMNMAHRDLKPENFLFKSDSLDSLKLSDFGCAEYCTSQNISRYRECGTHPYVPPEVLLGEDYDKSCDMWSLGVTLYTILSGDFPFYSISGADSSPRMLQRIVAGKFSFPGPRWNHISNEAKDLIKELLNTDPKKRISVQGLREHPWLTGKDRVLPCSK